MPDVNKKSREWMTQLLELIRYPDVNKKKAVADAAPLINRVPGCKQVKGVADTTLLINQVPGCKQKVGSS